MLIILSLILVSIKICNGQGIIYDSSNYLGCWRDSYANRALRYRQDQSKEPYNFPHDCFLECQKGDYWYYALQNYGECWCDNILSDAIQYGKALFYCPPNGGSLTFQLYFVDNRYIEGLHSFWHDTVQGEADGTTINLSCPWGEMVAIEAAIYGANCGTSQNVDDYTNLHIACSDEWGYGYNNCQYKVDKGIIGDPASNCQKEYFYVYFCWGLGTSDYIGCFRDRGGSNRALPYRQDSTKEPYSQRECENVCETQHFAWYGLQYYGECWCGKELPRAIQWGEAEDCPQKGGPWTFQLYYSQNKPNQVGLFWHFLMPTPLAGKIMGCEGWGTRIEIQAAAYGTNCDRNDVIDDTDNIKAVCDGKLQCSYFPNTNLVHPNPNCDPQWFVAWFCVL